MTDLQETTADETPAEQATALQQSPAAQIGYYLEARIDKLATCLNGALPIDRFKTMAMNTIRQDQRLATSTPQSVYDSLMRCAELQVYPGSALGHGYLVAFYNSKKKRYVCTFILGYRGMVALCHRSSKVKKVEAHSVHETDYFSITHGQNGELVHRPDPWAQRTKENCVGVYAIAWLENGTVLSERLSKAEVERARERSKAKDDGPWVTDWLPMARKTAVRRLSPWLPLEPREAEQIAEDEAREYGYAEPREADYEVVENVDADAEELRTMLAQEAGIVERDLEAAAADAEAKDAAPQALTLDQEHALGEWYASDEVDAGAANEYLEAAYSVKHFSQLTEEQADEVLTMMQNGDFAPTEG